MTSEHLLREIDQFKAELAAKGKTVSDYYLGYQATGNGRVIARIREAVAEGKPARIWHETEMAIRAYMLAVRSGAKLLQRQRPRQPKTAGAA